MRKSFTYSILCVLLIIFSASEATCQIFELDSIIPSSEFFNSEDFVNLSNDDQPKSVFFRVEKGTSKLTLQLGSITNLGGGITFEIFDPNGKKQEEFTLWYMNKMDNVLAYPINLDRDYATLNENIESSVNFEEIENFSNSKGHFLREFTNPLPGKWQITVTPREDMDGKFKINQIISM